MSTNVSNREKVVVIHRLGVSDSYKDILWKALGDVTLRIIDVDSIKEELEYKREAILVVCLPEVSDEVENFEKRWKYKTKYLALGQPARKTDSIEYVESIEKWYQERQTHRKKAVQKN